MSAFKGEADQIGQVGNTLTVIEPLEQKAQGVGLASSCDNTAVYTIKRKRPYPDQTWSVSLVTVEIQW